jgi:aldehyde:ferredoxin oxidoreductase
VELNAFEAMKDEYYKLRGWDIPTGFPTRSGLQALRLDDVADDLAQRGLVK